MGRIFHKAKPPYKVDADVPQTSKSVVRLIIWRCIDCIALKLLQLKTSTLPDGTVKQMRFLYSSLQQTLTGDPGSDLLINTAGYG